VYVAPPTGEPAADRVSILAALGAVRPGGTVQFAPGTVTRSRTSANTRRIRAVVLNGRRLTRDDLSAMRERVLR
jgi:hypothetical protein